MTKAPTIDAIVRGPKLFRQGIRVACELLVGDPLGLVRESTNPVDSNAVIITTMEEVPFGYIQREKAVELARWMDQGWVYTCKVLIAATVKRERGWIGFKTDSMVVRCTPIQPIGKTSETDISIFKDMLKTKTMELVE